MNVCELAALVDMLGAVYFDELDAQGCATRRIVCCRQGVPLDVARRDAVPIDTLRRCVRRAA